MAIDGSGLENHWVNVAYPTIGTKLQQLFTNFITARLADFPGMTLGGIFWIQGEADAGEAPDATDYYANLGTLFSGLRATFTNPWKLVINRLSKRATGGQLINVRSEQEDYIAGNTNCGLVSGDEYALRDTAHYVDDGYPPLGTRFGQKLVDLRAGTTTAEPKYIGAGVPVVAASGAGLTSVPFLVNYATNDIGLLVVSGIGNTNYAAPAGWTEVTGSPQHDGASGTNARLQVFWKRLTAGAETAPTVADVAGDDAKIGVILHFRGCTTSGNPWDTSSGTTAATSTTVSFPTVTTSVANTIVVNLCSIHNDIGTWQFDTYVNASLTNLTDQLDYNTTTGTGAGIGVATGTKAAAGAVSATTATIASTSTQALLTIALKP
jgi:hypothetical protein